MSFPRWTRWFQARSNKFKFLADDFESFQVLGLVGAGGDLLWVSLMGGMVSQAARESTPALRPSLCRGEPMHIERVQQDLRCDHG